MEDLFFLEWQKLQALPTALIDSAISVFQAQYFDANAEIQLALIQALLSLRLLSLQLGWRMRHFPPTCGHSRCCS